MKKRQEVAMAQMVLPQTPSPGIQQESGPSRSGNGRDKAERKSDFESVSQAEQKRLDRQKAERKDNANSADESHASRSDTGESESAGGKAAKTVDEGSAESSEVADSKAVEAEVVGDETEQGAIALPLTFAELQSWLSPKSGGAGEAGPFSMTAKNGSGSSAGATGQLSQGNGLFKGLLADSQGQKGKASASSVQDATLTEAMKAASLSSLSETGRNGDSGTALAAGRFQSALDLVAQQGASGTNAAAKLAAETAGPLKSYATSIGVPVGHAEWGDKLVGKLSWLTARNMSVAEIHLTPPDMGPMEVKVRVQNEQANITVHSANPIVRDQLELHSHRLRDMLGEQGLSLAGFDVADSSRQQAGEQEAGNGDGTDRHSSSLADIDGSDEQRNAGSLDLSWKGEVDIFA